MTYICTTLYTHTLASTLHYHEVCSFKQIDTIPQKSVCVYICNSSEYYYYCSENENDCDDGGGDDGDDGDDDDDGDGDDDDDGDGDDDAMHIYDHTTYMSNVLWHFLGGHHTFMSDFFSRLEPLPPAESRIAHQAPQD